MVRQYHDCSPVLQRPLQNKPQATEHYINSWYLFPSMRCETTINNHYNHLFNG